MQYQGKTPPFSQMKMSKPCRLGHGRYDLMAVREGVAEIRQLFVILGRGSASIIEDQAVLAQFVVQRLARQTQGLGNAA